MNRRITTQNLGTTTLLAAALFLFGGCGALPSQQAGINPSSVQVSVSNSSQSLIRILPGESGGGSRALLGESGGGSRTTTMYSLSTTSNTVFVGISGQAIGSDSVIASLDGKELALQPDAQGNFSALIAVDAIPQAISFTPVSNGFLGNEYIFDAANIALIP